MDKNIDYKKKYHKYKSLYTRLRAIRMANPSAQTHRLPIQNPPHCPTFDLISSGVKTVEGRKNSPSYHSYRVGDILIFEHKKRQVQTIITAIKKYVTLEDYLEAESFDKVLPCAHIKSFADAVNQYNQWSRQSDREALAKTYGYGFLGIHVQKI